MPYIANQNLSEEQKKKQLQQSQGGFGVSGESTSFNQSQNANQAHAPKPQKQSGSWVNLNQYLDANKDQATAMGNKIADTVEQTAVKANNSINSLKANAPGVISAVKTDDWFSNPDANKKEAYASLKNTGGYNGPDSIDKIAGFQDVQQNVNKADTQVKNAGTEIGRFNLLQDAYNRPQYSQGLKKLDNVLLQQNTESKSRFEDLGNKFKGILDTFNSESSNIGNQINSNVKQAAKNKQDLLLGESKAKQDLVNPIQARAAQLNRENPELVNRVTSDLSDDTLNAETLSLLGLNDGQSLYDLNLGAYLNPNLTQVGLNEAATAEERAKYQALAAMIDDPTMSQITADGRAIKPVEFNSESFTKDLEARQAAYSKALNEGRYTGNGSAVTFNDRRISDMSLAELQAALPAMRELQTQNNEMESFQGQPMFQQLPIAQIEEILNSVNQSYNPNRRITRG